VSARGVAAPGDGRSRVASFWGGRIILILLAAVVAEYGFVRRAWVIGSLGLAVAVVAAVYAAATWRRAQGRRS
jgi:hypothetical protein